MRTLVLSRTGLGQADPPHRLKLLHELLLAALSSEPKPARVLLYAEGVKLAAQTGGVLETLQQLEVQGVEILVSTECIAHYGVAESLFVGRPSPMQAISRHLLTDPFPLLL